MTEFLNSKFFKKTYGSTPTDFWNHEKTKISNCPTQLSRSDSLGYSLQAKTPKLLLKSRNLGIHRQWPPSPTSSLPTVQLTSSPAHASVLHPRGSQPLIFQHAQKAIPYALFEL